MSDARSCPLWMAWIGPGECFSAHWANAGAPGERSIRLEYDHAGNSTPDVRRYVENMSTGAAPASEQRQSGNTSEAEHIRFSSMGPGDTYCTVYGESIASSDENKSAAAFALYNEAGLLVCVAIPNPLLADAAMETEEARCVVTIGLEGTAQRTARSFFSDPHSVHLEMKELVRATAYRYQVDRQGRVVLKRT